ncbi:hypothetical protein [Arthrobacter sp. D5-1]|uniref:hypothetical protein n=1 Tax=Arthrobacter sp. D5-1 TaxID=1477518 RepID=UPI001F609914|nr:hypothetical protein [Arthrobacter sp. D5-1]
METALKVKANATAAQALDQGLTLEQSAVIEEFADDADAVATLERLATENSGNFAHRAQRLRDERKNNALLAEACAEAAAKGLAVLEEDPSYYDYKGPAALISALTTAEGERLSETDADAVYIGIGYSGLMTRFAVADWKARGLRKDGKAPAGGMTEEEKAARREVIEKQQSHGLGRGGTQGIRQNPAGTQGPAKERPEVHRPHDCPFQLHPDQGLEQDRTHGGTAGHRNRGTASSRPTWTSPPPNPKRSPSPP